MATNRLSRSTSSPTVDFYLQADELSNDPATNTHVVRAYLKAINRGNTTTNYNGTDASVTGAVGGSLDSKTEFGVSGDDAKLASGTPTGGTFWTYGPYDITTDGRSDGTASAYLSFTVTYPGVSGGGLVNGAFALTTLPRATVPALSNSSRQIGQATTISLPRASTSFTHDITYEFGALTGQTAGLSASTGVATSATFTVPQALVSQMVGQASRPLTFTVVTKSGSTVIGTKTVQLTVTPANGTIYQRPTVTVTVQRALSDGTPDADGVCAKVSIVAAVTSVLVSTEQNTLTWKTEVSANNGSTWQQLGTGTVSSHGLTLSSATTYTDSNPGTGGTQPFLATAGYLFRVTITDAYSNAAVQVAQMTTALAIFDYYDGNGDPAATGISVGALFNPSLGSRLQIGGRAASMRLPFADLTALNAFTGWPGLVGFVVADSSEYRWVSGAWSLWNAARVSYTPTLTNLTLGNGTVAATYSVADGVYFMSVTVTLGSTTSVTGALTVSAPFSLVAVGNFTGLLLDASAGSAGRFLAILLPAANGAVAVYTQDAGSTYTKAVATSGTVPMAWATGDQYLVAWSCSY